MPKFRRLAQSTVSRRLLPGLLVLLTSTLASTLVQAAPTPATNEAIPQALVLRLLKCPNDCVKNMQLLVGQLPAKLPVALPLPSQATVVATLIRDQERTEIVLDAPQAPAQIQAFYRNALKSAGWTLQGDMQEPGFQASDASDRSQPSTFCQGTQGPELEIVAGRQGQAPTDVRLYLNTHSESCTNLAASTAAETQGQALIPLPSLTAPTGMQVSETGLSAGAETFVAHAKMVTVSSDETLFTAYAEQLVQAGWHKQTTRQTDQSMASLWTLKDRQGEHWQGMLTLSPVEGQPNVYSAALVVFK